MRNRIYADTIIQKKLRTKLWDEKISPLIANDLLNGITNSRHNIYYYRRLWFCIDFNIYKIDFWKNIDLVKVTGILYHYRISGNQYENGGIDINYFIQLVINNFDHIFK